MCLRSILVSCSPPRPLDRVAGFTGASLVGVQQVTEGAFSGSATWLLSEQDGLDLVRIFLNDGPPIANLTDLEQDALSEIGNIILNGYLGGFVSNFGGDTDASLPAYLSGSPDGILSPNKGVDPSILVSQLVIGVGSSYVKSCIVYEMNRASIDRMRADAGLYRTGT